MSVSYLRLLEWKRWRLCMSTIDVWIKWKIHLHNSWSTVSSPDTYNKGGKPSVTNELRNSEEQKRIFCTNIPKDMFTENALRQHFQRLDCQSTSKTNSIQTLVSTLNDCESVTHMWVPRVGHVGHRLATHMWVTDSQSNVRGSQIRKLAFLLWFG